MSRTERIADAAVGLVAAGGTRALTHRAVDTAAGLPAGSTSYYLRTRSALLGAAVDHLVRLDLDELAGAPAPAGPPTREHVTAWLAALLARWRGPGRDRHLARWALSLEARSDPDLRRRLDAAGTLLREHLAATLAALGADEPQRRARWLAAACDGLLLDELAGHGSTRPLDAAGLHAAAADLVAAVLGPPG
ncbi:TetR/AcrR family transcriptional regulator [Kineococcus sp. NUM-3379]